MRNVTYEEEKEREDNKISNSDYTRV